MQTKNKIYALKDQKANFFYKLLVDVIGRTRNIICTVILYAIYMYNYKIREKESLNFRNFIKGYYIFYGKIMQSVKVEINLNMYNGILSYI